MELANYSKSYSRSSEVCICSMLRTHSWQLVTILRFGVLVICINSYKLILKFYAICLSPIDGLGVDLHFYLFSKKKKKKDMNFIVQIHM